jgi:hypothetical protein
MNSTVINNKQKLHFLNQKQNKVMDTSQQTRAII